MDSNRNRNRNDNDNDTLRSQPPPGPVFIHREIFHFLPHQVESFRTRLLTDPVIDAGRQMPGCYSFDIYCRATEPMAERGCDADSISDSSSSEEREENEEEKTTTTPTATAEDREHDQQQEQQAEAASQPTCDDLNQESETAPEEEAEEDQPEAQTRSTIAPHQFMAIGRWENKASHEGFFLARHIQKFFCSIMSRRVYESFPVLSMWHKTNGQHTPFHPYPYDSEDGQEVELEPFRKQGRFAMTRKRLLCGAATADTLEKALHLTKSLADHALQEEGCCAYDVCVTGHPRFNNDEILELGVWESRDAFVHHGSQFYWVDTEFKLCSFFDLTKDELLFWATPQSVDANSHKYE